MKKNIKFFAAVSAAAGRVFCGDEFPQRLCCLGAHGGCNCRRRAAAVRHGLWPHWHGQ